MLVFFSSKTYPIKLNVVIILNREVLLETISLEQYFDELNTGQEVRETKDFGSSFVAFEHELDSNQKAIDTFNKRIRHKELDVY